MLSVNECYINDSYRNQKDTLIVWPNRSFGQHISSSLILMIWPQFLQVQSNIFIPIADVVVTYPIANPMPGLFLLTEI